MKLSKIAKSEGLSNLQRFSEFQVNKLSTTISKKLAILLKDYNLSEEQLFNVLQTLNMFSAKFTNQNISAKYHYESNTIFISQNLDLFCPDSVVIHECLHFLQSEIEKNKVVKMGLYNVKSYKNKGLALNEAAVQIIASLASNIKPSSLTYFGMQFISPSPEYYTLETTLIRQMSYFTGTYPLFYSTLYSADLFKDVFSNITSKKLYEDISKNMNELIALQDKFLKIEDENTNEKEKESIKDTFRKEIQDLISNTQKCIYRNAFTKQFKQIRTKQDIQNFRANLFNFKNYLIEIPNDNSFEQFKDSMTSDLISLEIELEQKGFIENTHINKSLSPINNFSFSFLRTLFYKLKLSSEIFFKIRQKEEDYL